MRRNPNRPPVRSIIREPLPSQGPHPYDPESPGHAERHRVFTSVMPNGLTVETVGAPRDT